MIDRFTDHAANERTFLAWVRTAISIVVFGLAAARLHPQPPEIWSEIGLLAAGAGVILLAFLRMRLLHKRIETLSAQDSYARTGGTLLVILSACLFLLIGLFALHIR